MRFPEEKMERFYPGVYTPEEQAALDAWVRMEDRMPPMPPQAQPKDFDVVSGFELSCESW